MQKREVYTRRGRRIGVLFPEEMPGLILDYPPNSGGIIFTVRKVQEWHQLYPHPYQSPRRRARLRKKQKARKRQ
jgi:hypothetical protein